MKKLIGFVKNKSKKMLIPTLIIAALIPISAGDNYFEISKNLEIFTDVYKELNLYYVDDIEPNKLMRTGIDAMVGSLDPYTNYISEAEMEHYRFQTTGKYGGIGATIRRKGDYISIIEPYVNSPALKAGLRAGDLIIEINNKSAKNKSVEDVSNVLKGAPGTELVLKLRRFAEPEDFIVTIIRDEINVESVSFYGFVTEDIGYIKLDQFTDKASKKVADAYRELNSQRELKAIILDLRGNPGGLLNEAVDLSNLFIDKNKLAVATKGKMMNQEFKTLNKPIDLDIPIAVLTDRGSASASEIVSGVIQDYDRGVVVGKRTFGKGLVQQTRNVSYKTLLKLTTAKYYIPSGRCIQSIDYSHKDDEGVAGKIPDSLKNAFKTMSGRTVYDGGGIEPDIFVETPKYAKITQSLVSKDLIFDYATQYRHDHESIPSPEMFKLLSEEYEDFIAFLSDKDYDYTTGTEEALSKLENQSKDENYYSAVEAEILELKKKIQHDKQNDLMRAKEEIVQILEREIVSRYYHLKGRIQASFDEDPYVQEAIKVLGNKESYTKILKPGN